ncbi:MAG: hypothetical protein ACP5RJ_01720 [Conexivisphaera sp.]|jgi:uncharacterized protein related to proFAR isomerase
MGDESYVGTLNDDKDNIYISDVMEIVEKYNEYMKKVSEYYDTLADRGIRVISSTSSMPSSTGRFLRGAGDAHLV